MSEGPGTAEAQELAGDQEVRRGYCQVYVGEGRVGITATYMSTIIRIKG